MSDNFDWQTEDNDDWVEVESVLPETTVSRKPSWRTIFLVAGLLGVAGLLINWQYNRRIEALTSTIETDVLSTHNLINRAVIQQDLELMAPLLSAKEIAWTKAQEDLMEQELFYDRAQLDLLLNENGAQLNSLTPDDDNFIGLEVVPDMNEAVLSFTQEFDAGFDEGIVLLQQTAVYRRGNSRWLLSPPSEEFWGNWKTLTIDHLTLVYPARDADLVEQLAPDLQQMILHACQETAVEDSCTSDFRVHLRFDTDPESLLAAADPAALYDGNLRINLPTPTLVGLPVDEAGYQAVLRSYTAPVVAVLITDNVGWECCEHASLYQTFMDYLLAELALRPWPVNSQTYTDVVNSGLNLDAIFPFWIEDSFFPLFDTNGWQLYAFTDFLMRSEQAPAPYEMLQSLTEQKTFQQWLAELYGTVREEGLVIQDRLSRDWWLDAQAQMLATQTPAPISLPDQDLLLACDDESDGNLVSSLYRLELPTNQWHPYQKNSDMMFLTPLADDKAAVVVSIDFSTELWRTELWENGQLIPMYDDENSLVLSWGRVNPTGNQMLLFAASPYVDEELGPVLADIESCKKGSCTFTPLTGLPIWSPNGEQAILVETGFLGNGLVFSDDGRTALLDAGLYFQNSSMSRASDLGSSELPMPADNGLQSMSGNLPFWLDDETYGYVSTISVPDADQQLVLASIHDDVAKPILTSEQLLETIPEAERPFRLAIRLVQPYPNDPNLLFIIATSRLDTYLFIFDLQNQLLENPLQFSSNSAQFMGFSPDGRYLLLTGSPAEDFRGPENVVAHYLYDITRNKTQTFIAGAGSLAASYTFDWSADGNWLALSMNNGTINLIAPDYNYQHLLQHDFGDCSSLAWVNSLPE